MSGGRKNDRGKRRWSLVPWEAMSVVVDVLERGAAEYGEENWRKVEHARERYWNAAMRHLVAWRSESATDEESGLSHLAHAACCVLFLLAVEEGEVSAALAHAQRRP